MSVPWGSPWGSHLSPLAVPVFIEVLEPFQFERSGPEAASDAAYVEECHQRVLDAMQLTLDRLMEEQRLIRRRGVRGGFSVPVESSSGRLMTDERSIDQSRREYVAALSSLSISTRTRSCNSSSGSKKPANMSTSNRCHDLATVDSEGATAVRTVLLEFFDQAGFVFFINLESRKAEHIDGNNRVALLFWWPESERQIEINGVAERISSVEAAKYFMTRRRGSQLGAWVSHQSEVLTSRKALEMKLDEMKRKFVNREVPLPSFWGGYRVVPAASSSGRGNRVDSTHRFKYVREGEGWRVLRLAP